MGAKQTANKQVAADTPATAARRGRGSGLIAPLALLLALTALGLSGWQYYQAQQVQANDASLRRALQTQVSAAEARLQTWQNNSLQELNDTQQNLNEQLRQWRDDSQARYGQLQALLQEQRRRLSELEGVDRSNWMLAEVEYLLRLAGQRLAMAADLRSAIALLGSADGILQQLDQPGMHAARMAIAGDLAALRGAPRPDIEGTWMRIQALAGQVDNLALFTLPAPIADSRPAESAGNQPAAGPFQQRLQSSVRAALQKLSSYVVVRRRQAPYEALMDPQWESMVRQNLHMLLGQSRSALLSGNQKLYTQSLADARRWLAEFFSLNETGVAALDAELAALEALPVRREAPDISNSINAIKALISARLQAGLTQ
ncbi:MAG: uroporphyrinogen-III C-methyltransferase [Halieaceae bacterium]|nr:uroporphyrinogen-III C-methyltransferase [Halieaceae bacterium]